MSLYDTQHAAPYCYPGCPPLTEWPAVALIVNACPSCLRPTTAVQALWELAARNTTDTKENHAR